jgi:1-acyl-sn-glycerol-3-phosphate acyltransferase
MSDASSGHGTKDEVFGTSPAIERAIANRRPGAVVIVRSLAFGCVFYMTTAVFLIFGSPLLLAPRSWAMAGLRIHARTCLWLLRGICGLRYEVRGRNRLPDGPCLVASKHHSAWDTFALIPLLRDPAIVLKTELLSIPIYGAFCRKFEHIAIVRERAGAALKQLVADARQRVGSGRQILVFPEGTRRPAGALPDYKPGVVALYEALGVPCVPLALSSGAFWARGSWWRYSGTIVVSFEEPIPPGLPRRQFRDVLIERIETRTALLLAEALPELHTHNEPKENNS